MSEVVQQSVERGVAVLTLNRPERLNAWTHEMERDYFALLDECAAREDVRVIVLTGAGRGFCAGADMEDLQAIGQDGVQAADGDGRRAQTFPLTVPKPIIAAINGPCAGIGLVQALMCDIRFAAAGAKRGSRRSTKLATPSAKSGCENDSTISRLASATDASSPRSRSPYTCRFIAAMLAGEQLVAMSRA